MTLGNRFDQRRLRWLLSLFFVALALPSAVLIYSSYDQLKWEAFHRHRIMAEELAARIDEQSIELIVTEEARSFADYSFLVVGKYGGVEPSPLSAYPVKSELPGLVGYFQVDSDGAFSSPLLPPPGTEPQALGMTQQEYAEREALERSIRDVLAHNRLIRPRRIHDVASREPSEEGARERDLADGRKVSQDRGEFEEQLAFDDLKKSEVFDASEDAPAAPPGDGRQRANTLGRLDELKLDRAYAGKSLEQEPREPQPASVVQSYRREKRKEQSSVPEQQLEGAKATPDRSVSNVGITTFESEIDPFELSMLNSGHFVLFRKVWRDGRRYIQGALIEQQPFIDGIVGAAFRPTALSAMSNLIVAYQDDVVSAFTGDAERGYLGLSEELRGALLYQRDLSAPLGELRLVFSITELPAGPGADLLIWITVILAVVLCGGFYLLYRLGIGQLELAAQQQDFVSAVSHELKTPLTSIRMYGEMLKEGWADDEKKKEYYDYIHEESERLSRLIANVLQLARMTRNDLHLELKTTSVAELMDQIRSKIATQVQRAGFELALSCDSGTREVPVSADTDSFAQIVINLVDNAVKFAAKAEKKVIEIGALAQSDDTVMFTVRDFGSGVPRDQMKKIFALFYRSENELTRESVGTGIGLALVRQLAAAMNGRVDVVNREPGAEFRVWLPVASSS